jgi:hypothetical protein
MMAFTDVVQGEDADAPDVQQIIDALQGAAGKGQPIALTALNDPANYALDVRNLDGTNGYVARFRNVAGTLLLGLTKLLARISVALQLDEDLNANKGINVGTSTGAATGSVKASGQFISEVTTGTAPLVVASTTEVANLKAADAGKLGGQGSAYYAQASVLSAHVGETTGFHGLPAGAYGVGCKQGVCRIERKNGTASVADAGGAATISVTWDNVFSSVLDASFWGYTDSASREWGATRNGSLSVTGASISGYVNDGTGSTTVTGRFIAIGT